jgi:hypothetical protein
MGFDWDIPSGKHTISDGKITSLNGKINELSIAMFNSFLLVYQRVSWFTTIVSIDNYRCIYHKP